MGTVIGGEKSDWQLAITGIDHVLLYMLLLAKNSLR